MERRDAIRALLAATVPVAGAAGPASASGVEDGSDTMTTRTDQDADGGEQPADDCAVPDDGLVTVESDCDFEATVDRVRCDVEASPLTLVTTVDHAANAASAGLELSPTTLFVFGNPEAGTPLMQAERSVAIDLPQKLLVWADEGEVYVTYNDPTYLAERHDIEGQEERLEGISTALRRLATGGD